KRGSSGAAAAAAAAAATAATSAAAAAAAGVPSASSDAELLSRLLSALLRCCENAMRTTLGKDIRVRCGECLGLLGALDPARVVPERRAPPALLGADEVGPATSMSTSTSTTVAATSRGLSVVGNDTDPYALEIAIVKQLVRIMETTGDLMVYRCTSYALQCLLQHYSGGGGSEGGGGGGGGYGGRATAASPEPEGLYGRIPPDIQPLVKPYLTTRYTLEKDVGRSARAKNDTFLSGPAIFSANPRPSYRRWLNLWIRAMLRYAVGPHQAAFTAMTPVMRLDLPLMTLLLPQVVHAVLVSGHSGAIEAIRREVVAVLEAGAVGPSEADGQLELYLQALFGLLDVLGRWVKE
ncbi:hypothetical protein Vafri_15149, partial [Volvox africanus]